MNPQTQIVATIGPATKDPKIIKELIEHGLAVVRLNFSWGTYAEHAEYIKNIREQAQILGQKIPIIQDLSGPRIQEAQGHEFNDEIKEIITEKDLADLKFGLEQNVDYVAMSFVENTQDILKLREKMQEFGKVVPIIAKIERQIALDNLDEIIKTADAIMIARGDLGNEIPLEQIPFIQKDIIQKCKIAGKPVIVATQVLFSMKENSQPTRAEMTDIIYAVLGGTDALMLSEETATGKYPLEAVAMMKRGIIEAEKYTGDIKINHL